MLIHSYIVATAIQAQFFLTSPENNGFFLILCLQMIVPMHSSVDYDIIVVIIRMLDVL